ncbi:coiled-coil domain-containing protein [Govanella unica]|uniref:ATPase n=1 Tax=Govanella unica TaxID=2975056 RepID=A0A9X3TX09_9PROT|nr:hypothetical protein [Govania unica]MDA5193193.1 hypothetical protein [Govania unica]
MAGRFGASDEQNDITSDSTSEVRSARSISWARRYWPLSAAAVLSIAWLAAAIGWIITAAPALDIRTLPVTETAALIAGIIAPVGVIWLVALVVLRTDPLREQRLALSHGLHDLLAPVEQAEKRVATLTQKLQKQIEAVDAAGDIASQRITVLENRFAAQIQTLFTATTEAEKSAGALSGRLAAERTAMDALKVALGDNAETIGTILTTTREALETASQQARREAENASARVQTDAARMQESLTASAHAIKDVSGALQDTLDGLKNGLGDAELSVDAFSKRTEDRQAAFHASITDLSRQAEGLTALVDQSAVNIAALSAKASADTAELEAAIARQTGSMSEAAAGALAQTTEAGRGFETQARALAKIAADALAEAESHMANARAITVRDVEAASEAATRAVWGLDEISAAAAENLTRRIQDAKTAIETQTEAMTLALDARAHVVEDSLAAAAQKLKQAIQAEKAVAMTALEDHQTTVAGALEEQARAVRAAVERQNQSVHDSIAAQDSALNDALAQHTTVIRDSLTRHEDAARDALLGKAEDIRAILDAQMEAARAAFESQATTLDATALRTGGRLTELIDSLQRDLTALSDRAATAEDRLDKAGAGIAFHQASFESFARSIADQSGMVESLSANLADQAGRMEHTVATVKDSLNETTNELENRLTLLAKVAGDRLQEVDAVRGNFGTAVATLVSETESALARLAQAGDVAANQRGAATGEFEALLRRLAAASDAVRDEIGLLGEASRSAETEASRVTTLLRAEQNEIRSLSDGVNETAATLERSFRTRIQGLEGTVRQMEKSAEDLLSRTAKFEASFAESTRTNFARTASLLIEALGSAAIDIHRSLDTDIPEDLWRRYLKGERSIFARSTIRLGDKATREAIATKYEVDSEFRDHTERYLAEFQELMAQALKSDPKSVLGVTLISSELGKLYVLIGQSLKRLK